MGEIVSMIAGLAKVKLSDTLGYIHLLTPWVISERNLTIASPGGTDGELALDSQAAISWVMTKVEFEKGTFMVSVQPNAFPEENKFSSDSNKEVESLKNEVKELKDEIERLKS